MNQISTKVNRFALNRILLLLFLIAGLSLTACEFGDGEGNGIFDFAQEDEDGEEREDGEEGEADEDENEDEDEDEDETEGSRGLINRAAASHLNSQVKLSLT